ncbi:hypothetical protein GW17_00038862 [Ensete ventricosum]|uniref:Uncharacterized protein n=1 Tax=Ensete ventricosum TaxID=4639 RepID=A0A444DJI8_ENSVE|nr:hypothetical protein B296_00038477 [Ensete ventricosum]RWV98298.1 hypothetical protein GW17_00038862 [Ensete ventricosum]RZS01197.1 hypothetical protein BHM03_00031023 [Ensete ventricosum]
MTEVTASGKFRISNKLLMRDGVEGVETENRGMHLYTQLQERSEETGPRREEKLLFSSLPLPCGRPVDHE